MGFIAGCIVGGLIGFLAFILISAGKDIQEKTLIMLQRKEIERLRTDKDVLIKSIEKLEEYADNVSEYLTEIDELLKKMAGDTDAG